MLLLLLLLLPGDLVIAGHSLDALMLGYRSESLPALARLWFGTESWHLMGYLLIILPLGMLVAGKRGADYSALAVALACAVGLYFTLFLFTKFSYGAIHHTAAGRIGLHLIPSLTFFAMLVWHSCLSRFEDPRRERSTVPSPVAGRGNRRDAI